ncbi:hypothetical protein BLOT_011925 [Blomia tropicalis]|nr:hypothetical protein BLOT_011925 [Blomia tropicalis]
MTLYILFKQATKSFGQPNRCHCHFGYLTCSTAKYGAIHTSSGGGTTLSLLLLSGRINGSIQWLVASRAGHCPYEMAKLLMANKPLF